ncbi:MAG: glycosyltransferase [Nitrospirae bacterium]|nr:glycosyltransferase [Nitrospirota bacterium]
MIADEIKKDDRFILAKARSGSFTLRVTGEDGTVKTLHSFYDPEAEAKGLVSSFDFDGRGIIVVLGLGLGYHVDELTRKFPHTEIIVVEPMTKIYEIAKEHGPAISDRVILLTGLSSNEALREITRYQMKDGLSPVVVFTQKSSVAAFANYYKPILNSLKNTMAVRLWDRLKYKKFAQDTLDVVLIESGYFLVKEVEKALLSLNHRVHRVPVRKNDKGDTIVSRLIETILEVKPDFILTINHLGFDEEGALTSFFRSIEMPVASWFVDSPHIILSGGDRNISPCVSMFLWDKEYIGSIEDMGFESVSHLPLASDEKVFKPLKLNQRLLQKYQTDVGFVGNSLVDETRRKMEKIPIELISLAEKAAARLSVKRMSFDGLMNEMAVNDLMCYKALSAKQRLDVESAVLWKATLLYRLSCITKLEGFNFHLYGDNGWNDLLSAYSMLKPPLNYYKDLPVFYNACNISFNATHLQMGEAVNQRVFDVPACGSFILTDYQESLEGLFDVGKEIVVYKSRDEIPELVKFYLDNPGERKAVAERGRERVLKEHTYKHRLQMIIDKMKGRYS